jgi:tRNA uridine 5-carboxymethylaminomethyl modification enzyme
LFEAKQAGSAAGLERLMARRFLPGQIPDEWAQRVLGCSPPSRDLSAFDLLRRPQVDYLRLLELDPALAPDLPCDERLAPQVLRDLEVRTKYAGYIERAAQEIERNARQEHLPMPADLDYRRLTGLSHEVRQQLTAARPATLGQASRIPGVTPAAVSILLVHLRRHAG